MLLLDSEGYTYEYQLSCPESAKSSQSLTKRWLSRAPAATPISQLRLMIGHLRDVETDDLPCPMTILPDAARSIERRRRLSGSQSKSCREQRAEKKKVRFWERKAYIQNRREERERERERKKKENRREEKEKRRKRREKRRKQKRREEKRREEKKREEKK